MLICAMRVLCFSIFIILASIMLIPNALANHDSDKQWGTIFTDKPVLELTYRAADNSQYEKIKIFGVVEEPRSSAFVFLTITEPNGKTYLAKVRPNPSDGNYVNYILICCNDVGTYGVSAEWRNNHIGTITFDVVTLPKSQPTTTPTAEPIIVIPDWIKIHARWWADGQINDSAYLLGIQYLIKEGIMVIPTTETSEYSSSQVPVWVKNSARWWADGQINDITYISGIQYLVNVGIIKVS